MKYNPDIHHRKSIRLKGYDYSKSGLYFITICTYEGLNFLGEIEKGKMILNKYGKIVEEEILKTAEIRKNIEIDGYCIMPNHIHMIIEIKEIGLEVTDEKELKEGKKIWQMQKAGHEHRARTEEKDVKDVGVRCPCPENQKIIKGAKIIMRYNPDIHHRKSIRLKGYDYSKSGLYFITICTYEGLNFLGKIENGEMILNEYGKIAEEEILKTAEIRKNIEIDGYCIMPNHIHMIIEIKEGQRLKTGHEHRARTEEKEVKDVGGRCPCPENQKEQYGKPTKNTIPTIIRAIKASVTKRINKLNNSTETVIWHRNYYENIIRNEEVYLKVSEYIENNPKKWEEDRYYKMGNS